MADALNPALAFAAGGLTILSPCVLPLVPIVLGSAAQRHRLGPLALAAGLVASFTAVGFAVAAAGSGLDAELIRRIGAGILVLLGAVLLIPVLQHLAERAAAPLAAWAGARQNELERLGLVGQAGIGLLLGLVWSPCVGPTLGAATILAAEGKDLASAALTMAAFGAGIASVLLVLALATRAFIGRWRGRLIRAGGTGRRILGGVIVLVGLLILTGGDQLLEGLLVQASPEWLTDLTTSI